MSTETFIYTEEEVQEMYDDMLDSSYPSYTIGYVSYPASQVLKTMDPIAYDLGLSDFIDSMEEDL